MTAFFWVGCLQQIDSDSEYKNSAISTKFDLPVAPDLIRFRMVQQEQDVIDRRSGK